MEWDSSSTRISLERKEEESTRLKSVVLGVQKSKNLKISPVPFNFFSAQEARIHAHLCGDGSVWRSIEKRPLSQFITHMRKNIFRETWWLNYTNTCSRLREEFKIDFFKAFNRKLASHKRFDLRANSVKHIIFRLNLYGKNSYNWHIPREVTLADNKIKRMWLRAFFDDEATISLEKKAIRLKIVNKDGLLQIQKLLQDLKINSNITGPNIDATWFLNIRRNDILEFKNLIGFRHPKQLSKLRILATLISS